MVKFHQVRRQQGENMNTWYAITVTEGKYREVRRMWQVIGCKVSRLSRIRYGKVGLPRGLKPGSWIELQPEIITRMTRNHEKDKVFIPKPMQKSGRRLMVDS